MKKKLFTVLLGLSVFLIIPTANAKNMETGFVTSDQFTSEIVDRQPVNNINSVQAGQQISFFTDIRNMEGQTVTHRWIQEGEEIFSMQFHVGGNRWRVWTNKNIYDWNIGAIQVIVETEEGDILSQKTINVIE